MTPYRALIEQIAKGHGIPPNLVEAVVLTESSGHADAFRFEEGFYRQYLRDNPAYKGLIPRRVSSSYGLMQPLYTTARQYGFQEQPEYLFLPNVNLHWGCLHLAHLLTWANGEVEKAIAAYNAGQGTWKSTAGSRYVERVHGNLSLVQEARG
jgi:soluble lytic murein transglycosylase-like protein